MSNFVVATLVFSLICSAEAKPRHHHRGGIHDPSRHKDQKPHNMDWDFFMLVTEWPFSSCEQQNATHKHECIIPKEVTGWTIHGLWPSCNNGKYPQYCTQDKFDWTQVEDLKDRLYADWANLFADEPGTGFWKHEYEKHGTCAKTVPHFQTEHDFFERTLDLRDKYDMKKILGDKGIMPSDQAYKGSDIKSAINESLNNKACAACSKIKGIDGYVLMNAVVCVDKTLQLIDCPYCEQECYDDDKVYYQPMIH